MHEFIIKILIFYKFKKQMLKSLGIGDWGLGIGDWAQSPIPNPHDFIEYFYFFKI